MNNPVTKPARYEKNCTFFLNGKKYTLIDYLKEQRLEKKITKKNISIIVKNNDYWYSQIEMGKTDDCRRKYINRLDLISIISVIIYDAKNKLDIERYCMDSANYIDNILKLSSFDKQTRIVPVYEMINSVNNLYNPEYAANRLNNCLLDFNSVVQDFYNKCNIVEQSAIIHFLNNLILNLSVAPIQTLHYCGLPFSSFFTAQPQDRSGQLTLEQDFLKDLDSILKKYSSIIQSEDFNLIINKLNQHFQDTNHINNDVFNI